MTTAPWSLGRIPRRVNARLDRLSDTQFAAISFVPGAILVGLLVLPPIVAVFGMSLFRIELGKDELTPFVGARNYLTRLPEDAEFLASIPRTLLFAAGTTILAVPLGLITALALNRQGRLATLLGIVVLLPWAVAPVVTGIYWRFMFTNQFGIVNALLQAVGLEPVRWFNESSTAVAIAMVATTWRSVPLLALLLLGVLKAIPAVQYRAARIDGASEFQLFRFITLPAIRNMLLTVGILQIILGLQVFDVLFTLTGGGPGKDTYVMIYYIYDNAFRFLSFGYAAALTVFMFFVILACSAILVLVRVRRRRDAAESVAGAAAAGASDVDDLATLRITKSPIARPGLGRAEALPSVREPSLLARLRAVVWRATKSIGLIVLGLWLVAPIAWIAIASTQTEGALTSVPLGLQPSINLDGYAELLGKQSWQSSLLVSLEVAIGTTLLAIFIASLAAYPLARLQLRGKGLIMSLLIFTQMVPAIVLAIPVLLMFQTLHLKDSVIGLVLIDVAFWTPLLVWLLRSVFEDVPRSIELAARMDGCSRLGTLFRIAVPAARPGIAAVAILVLVGTWNEFLFAVVLGNRDAVTLTRWIGFIESYNIAGFTQAPPFHLLAAAGLITVLPCLLLVAVFQRRIVSAFTDGFGKA